jgi:hypothetical protein
MRIMLLLSLIECSLRNAVADVLTARRAHSSA